MYKGFVSLLCSKFVFAVVRWRIAAQCLKNKMKRVLSKNTPQFVNERSATDVLGRWLDKGYDKLNMGGGRKVLNGFVNVDFVPFKGVGRQVTANILDLSFIPNACISHIHTNHVLEHLTKKQLWHQLKEYHRILKDGGLLSIRCPNALGVSYGFWFDPVLERDRDEFIAYGFPADEVFGDPADKWMHKDLFGLLHWFYGDTGNIQNQHLNIITPSDIKNDVVKAGFNILKMADPEAINIVIVARKNSRTDVSTVSI
jgi:SAM-dependent methyltransferase